MHGTILKGIGGFYYVSAGNKIYECKARGVFRKEGISPLAGDRVVISPLGVMADSGLYEQAVIEEIEERLNHFERPPLSNVQTMVITASCRDPLPSFSALDRTILSALYRNCRVIIAVTKTDLVPGGDDLAADPMGSDDEMLSQFTARYGKAFPLFFINEKTGEGIDELRNALSGSQAALAGASGVGKSTLTNALLEGEHTGVGSISEKTSRGKNTTRHTELFISGDLALFDTPGFTSIDPPGLDEDDLVLYYPEYQPYLGQCEFADCSHIAERGCALRAAVRRGEVNKERYKLFKEIYMDLKAKREEAF